MKKNLLQQRRDYIKKNLQKRSTKTLTKRVDRLAKRLFLSTRTIWYDLKKST